MVAMVARENENNKNALRVSDSCSCLLQMVSKGDGYVLRDV